MNVVSPTRQDLIHRIDELPSEVLPELASFLEYLRFKVGLAVPALTANGQSSAGSTFLLAIAGLGSSDEADLSERDEEVLSKEIDPLRGWGLPQESKP